MLKLNQVKLPVSVSESELPARVAKLLQIPVSSILSLQIDKRSLDARKKPDLYYIYTVLLDVKNEASVLKAAKRNKKIANDLSTANDVKYAFKVTGTQKLSSRPVVVGMGPAGLFCGYFLALHGYRPILLERGRAVEARQKDVEEYWKSGRLNTLSNVQFGEGGAGTFSDGKLGTLVKDKDGRNRKVMEVLVQFGAKESILYDAKPHIGTDVLSVVVRSMREEIIRLGGEVRFETQVERLLIDQSHDGMKVKGVRLISGEELATNQVVLALGHSARDTFASLYEQGLPMEAKPFAVGFRVQHPQSFINKSQYGTENVKELGAAAYKVAAKASNGRNVFSFCMCPGGYVVNASSEEEGMVVNGMSYSGRNGNNANSAIIVSVTPEDYGSEHPLAGVSFQRQMERRAYEAGEGKVPVQRFGAFEEGKLEPEQEAMNGLAPEIKGAYHWTNMRGILPSEVEDAFIEGMHLLSRQISDFDRPDCILAGVESRTSSPVKMLRNTSCECAISGVYPCGEGAGYAGGITSAAMDGMRVAEAIAAKYVPFDKNIL